MRFVSVKNGDINTKVIKKACMAYKIIDEKSKREGIGYKSDHKSFEDLMIKNRSILHTPNV